MGEFLNSIDWSSVDWSLVIAIVALISTIILNLRTQQISKKSLELGLKKYKDEQEDKAKQKLEITVQHSSKFDEPLKWVGLWLIVNNRGKDQPLLVGVDVTLFFKKKWEKVEKPILKSILESFFVKPSEATISFPLYSSFKKVGMHLYGENDMREGFDCSNMLPLNFYLLDWESKSPIYFSPRNEFQMPSPGQKKRWYLFGNIPGVDGQGFMKRNFVLDKVEVTFVTDHEIIEIEEYMSTHLLDTRLLEKYSSYSFDFEEEESSK
jgi:hypothetical protein